MLVTTKELLQDAEKNNYAVANLNPPGLTILRAVIQAAEECDTPVILAHGQVQDPLAPIEIMGPLMIEFAKKSKVPCSVHLDHGFEEKQIYKAIRYGFSSVMADFSRFDFEENIARTQRICNICHELGMTVEGEFGQMPSNGTEHTIDMSSIDDITSLYTDPNKVNEYVSRTQVDSLVVSFGTVHGVYIEKPVMDYERLKDIKSRVGDLPLVMHGGSGLTPEETISSINGGIRKINYYTYMACEPAKHLAEYLADPNNSTYWERIDDYAKHIMIEKAKYAINLFKNKKQFSSLSGGDDIKA